MQDLNTGPLCSLRPSEISGFALYTGISDSTLRKYERQGVISPSRKKESKYRTYGVYEYGRVISCLEYKQYGCAIKDAVAILDLPDIETTAQALAQQEERLREGLEWEKAVLTAMEQLRAKMADCMNDPSSLRLEYCEESFYIGITQIPLEDSKDDFARRKTLHEMRGLLPISKCCSHVVWNEGRLETLNSGAMITAREAARWNPRLKNRCNVLFAGMYATAYVKILFSDMEPAISQIEALTRRLYAYAKTQGLQPDEKNLYIETVARTGRDEQYTIYRKLYVPLTKCN